MKTPMILGAALLAGSAQAKDFRVECRNFEGLDRAHFALQVRDELLSARRTAPWSVAVGATSSRDQLVRPARPPFIQSGEQHSVITGVPRVWRIRAIRRSRVDQS